MKVVIGLEIQIPYHDPKYVAAFIQFLKDYNPDELVMIGDFLDAPAPSRWNRGTAEEYASNLQEECNTGKRILADIRRAYDGRIGYHTGANHEKRIDVYARTKAPAFAGLDALKVSSLLDLDGYAVTELPDFYRVAHSVLTTHGDLGTLSKYGGGTAIAAARNQGLSVVCGHTHRHGLIYERFGRQTIFGMETGHGMSVAKAGYIKHGNPNWSSGWGVLEVTDKGVWPAVVPFRNGKVVWNG